MFIIQIREPNKFGSYKTHSNFRYRQAEGKCNHLAETSCLQDGNINDQTKTIDISRSFGFIFPFQTQTFKWEAAWGLQEVFWGENCHPPIRMVRFFLFSTENGERGAVNTNVAQSHWKVIMIFFRIEYTQGWFEKVQSSQRQKSQLGSSPRRVQVWKISDSNRKRSNLPFWDEIWRQSKQPVQSAMSKRDGQEHGSKTWRKWRPCHTHGRGHPLKLGQTWSQMFNNQY